MTLIEQISSDFMTAYKAKELTKKDFSHSSCTIIQKSERFVKSFL